MKWVVTAASVGMAEEDGSRGSASGLWRAWAEGRDLNAESSRVVNLIWTHHSKSFSSLVQPGPGACKIVVFLKRLKDLGR